VTLIDYVRQQMPGVMPDLSPQETSFDYYVDPDSSEWDHWQNKLQSAPITMSSIPFLPTLDSVRLNNIATLLLQHGIPIIVTGQSGVGKSATISDMFGNPNREDAPICKRIALGASSTPLQLQKCIEAELTRLQGGTFAPPNKKQLVLFVDDVNIPAPDQHGAVGTAELLRQLIEHKGFYSVDEDNSGAWMEIEHLQYIIVARQLPHGGYSLPARLKRHFVFLNLTLANRANLESMLSTLLKKQLDTRGMSYFVGAVASTYGNLNTIELRFAVLLK